MINFDDGFLCQLILKLLSLQIQTLELMEIKQMHAILK